MPSLSDKLRQGRVKPSQAKQVALWEGPSSAGPQGGVTFSLLSRFLVCRERFRLLVVKGLQGQDRFNHRAEYGQMWHTCEKVFAASSSSEMWMESLKQYCQNLCRQYLTQQPQIEHWYNVCRAQFPLYIAYWRRHPDVKGRVPIAQEQVFDELLYLPSGRAVRLRGKWDSVDLVRQSGLYLQENKTRGEIVEGQIKQQLQFDLQTMLYLVALQRCVNGGRLHGAGQSGVAGLRYNAVRRPLSGGKGSISRIKQREYRGKNGVITKTVPEETEEHFYGRLAEIISGDPGRFFMRWRVEVSGADLARFRHECLDPLLEQVCDWWGWITSPAGKKNPFSDHIHWRHPYGVYNILNEGGSSEMDEHLASGSMVGLEHTNSLFKELE